MQQAPHHYPADAWHAGYQAEVDAIARDGFAARRDAFNADFPAPYTGAVTAEAHARFAALGDADRRA